MKKLVVSLATCLVLVLAVVSLPVGKSISDVSIGKYTISIGSPAYAAGEADYTASGVDDHETFQTALDSLPAGGGQLVVFTGDYVWGAGQTVTRAIDNVTIVGIGTATSFSGDGVTPIFSAGSQTGWVFQNLKTDAGGITQSTDTILLNVTIGITLHSFKSATAIENPVGRGATYVVAASDSPAHVKAQADYVADGTADNVEIQAAIDALPAGGGTVLLTEGTFTIANGGSIYVRSYLTLEGMGKSTVLTLVNGANATPVITNTIDTAYTQVTVTNLRIEGNSASTTGAVNGIYFNNGVSKFHLKNTYIRDTRQHLVHLYRTSPDFIFEDNYFESTMSWMGVYIDNSSNNGVIIGNNFKNTFIMVDACKYLNITGNYFDGSLGAAVMMFQRAATDNSITNNVIRPGAGVYGLYLNGINYGANNDLDGYFIANNWIEGGSGGLVLGRNPPPSEPVVRNMITNNYISTSAFGITLGAGAATGGSTNNTITGNKVVNSTYGINIDANSSNNIITGNDLRGNTTALADVGANNTVKDNMGTEITDVRDLVRVKNTSGGTLTIGDVVVLKTVAAGNEVTTTTTQGDDKVFGMVAESIANNTSGLVLIEGKTVSLKVNGTTDIAIGDLLGTYTAAGIGMKAATGDMVFAIALETYTTDDSAGVIDALLIKPRKI